MGEAPLGGGDEAWGRTKSRDSCSRSTKAHKSRGALAGDSTWRDEAAAAEETGRA